MGDVDRAVVERQGEDVGFDELDAGHARERGIRDGQDVEIGVRRDDVPAAFGEGDRHVAGSGAHVENPNVVTGPDQLLDRTHARIGPAGKPVHACQVGEVGLDLGPRETAGIQQLGSIGPCAERQQPTHADGHLRGAPRLSGEAIFGVARGNRNAAPRRRDDPAVD